MHLSKLWHHKKSSLGRDYSPRNVRPIYDLSRNTDEIPYALFASPFYQQDLPRSLNYGGIGGTIAHELAARFLAEMKKSWNLSDLNFFNSITPCFEKQYKQVNRKLLLEIDGNYNENTSAEATQLNYYKNSKQRVPWSRTLNEDLADNIALQVAFKAYDQVLKEECAGIDTRLKGLENVTGLQLFFLSTARTQCRIADNPTLIKEIRKAKYSATPNRVNEAMKNFPEFGKAFNCSPGSALYPPRNETCSLW
ncbi:neprilysin-2-like [Dermacentor andersoni]|uniref:neprilysin-2-like n=1 Tax=Dermacentor andersoni TaxID=34620 RepID=UPI003B3AFAF1